MAILSGCNSGLSAPLSPQGARNLKSLSPDRKLPAKPCLRRACIYAVNSDSSVTVYAAGANGDVAPIRTISGSKTKLNFPASIALDAEKNAYVTSGNGGGWLVAVYAAGANGNVAPIRTITGFNTGLESPDGITLGADGTTYVANGLIAHWSVTEYADGANGNVMPIRTISGSNTGLGFPGGVVLDNSAQLYVANRILCFRGHCFGADQVTVYAAGANGDVAPIRTISGPNTQLSDPYGIALDAENNVYVTNAFSKGSYVTVYAGGANGDVAPIRTIGGSNTRLNNPTGIALNPAGHIFVVNYGGIVRNRPSVTEFAAGTNGNVKPIRAIRGSKTGLIQTEGGAVR